MSSPSQALSKADLLSRFQERDEDEALPDAFKLDDSQDLDLSFSKFSHVSTSSVPKFPANADSLSSSKHTVSSKHTASPFLKKIQMSVSNLRVDAFPSKPDPLGKPSHQSVPPDDSSGPSQIREEAAESVFTAKPPVEIGASYAFSEPTVSEDPEPAVQVSLTPAQRVEKHQGKQNINALSDFEIHEKIGRGAFADVYRGVNIKTKSVVAIKQINLDKDYDISGLMGEIDLLKILKHPNIVKYHGFVKTPDSLNVFLEYCQNGSLRQIYKRLGRGFSEGRIVSYVRPILKGLEYLHEQGVVHRDVKAANVLIDASGGVKLADFGVATKVATSHNTIVGTPNWMAPESVLGGDGICTASDIWSLGATVLELFTTHPPYHDLNPMAALHAIGTDEHPPIPVGFTPIARDFLLECFQKQPSLRTSASLLLKHRWLNQVNFNETIGELSEVSGSVSTREKNEEGNAGENREWNRSESVQNVHGLAQNVFGKNQEQRPQNQVSNKVISQVTPFSRAQLLQKFSEAETELSDSSMVLSPDKLQLALTKGNQEEDQDPFLELDINNFDTNELEVQMKMGYLLSKLVAKVGLCQQNSEGLEKSLAKITGRILHLVEKYPISHDILIRDHGVLTLMELLENSSELHEDQKLWFQVLGILNCIFEHNIAQIENFSLLGGIPMIIRFSKLSFGLKVRLQVVKFVKTLRRSEKALLMFVSSGGLRILSRFLEEDFETSPDFPLVAINCIHEILANDLTRFKSDMCRILSKYGVLFWFVVLLNRLTRLDQTHGHIDQSRFDSAEISSTIDKILEVIKFFGQAEVRVRINISNPDLFKLLIKVYPALSFGRQMALLKFFRSISCISEILRPLNSADILEFYVTLLRQYVPSNPHYKEVVNIVCPSLYNCCYLNRTRETELAKLGAIPLLRDLSKINLPFRQFVLPILCELVYCTASVRQLLIKHDVVTVYYNLLVDPYWHFNAMDSILYWNSQDPKFEILSSPIAQDCMVSGFMMAKVSNLEAVLENYLRVVTTNNRVLHLMSRDSVVESILAKLAIYKNSPAAKVTLLRLLHCILAYAWGSGLLHILATTIQKAMDSILTDSSILVKDLAKRVVKVISCR